MAEAEDVITDIARHATVYAQALWRRHRATSPAIQTVALADVAQRIDLLIAAVFGTTYRLRTAQPPAPTTFLSRAFRHRERPRVQGAIPATDGVSIWLPSAAGIADPAVALDRLRAVALQQAMRASRGSAALMIAHVSPLVRDLYLLMEAHAADDALARQLPGIVGSLNALRRAALAVRPAMASFPVDRRPLERFVRTLLQRECGNPDRGAPVSASPEESARVARRLAAEIAPDAEIARRLGANPLFKDWWTGELRAPNPVAQATAIWSALTLYMRPWRSPATQATTGR